MTQTESARKGIVTEAMRAVASEENVSVEKVVSAIAEGTAVIPLNIHHSNCRSEQHFFSVVEGSDLMQDLI